jgi:hypothetical protein
MSKYAGYLPETLQEAYVALVHDQDHMDLREELALLRATLARYVQENGESIDRNFIMDVTKLLDKVTTTQETISRHEHRMREVIPVKMIPLIIAAIAAILEKYIPDAQTRELVSGEIGKIPLMIEHKANKRD